MSGHSKEPTASSLTDTVVNDTLPRATTTPPSISGHANCKPIQPENTTASQYATIPPDHSNRTLVLCFDGTGDYFDADNSNIVQFVSLLKKNDRRKQMVYYQAGIGTYISPMVATPFTSRVFKLLDNMFAWNLHAHVMAGYEFLMQNYIDGDKISIFGFSRGAYTARSLAGMLHKVGLLPADNWQQVPFAYKMYTKVDQAGWDLSDDFKAAFSIPVVIDFLGVWDTVDSVGLVTKRLPFTTSNTIVKTFRHAISLDERRAKFKANLWNRPNAKEAMLGTRPAGLTGVAARDSGHKVGDKAHNHTSSPSRNGSQEDRKLDEREQSVSEKEEHRETNIEEVWFSGCHCDIGGGSVGNHTSNSLARIPLRWMIRECFRAEANTGIMFDSEGLRNIGLNPSTLYPVVLDRPRALSSESYSYQRVEDQRSGFQKLFSRTPRPTWTIATSPPPLTTSTTTTTTTSDNTTTTIITTTTTTPKAPLPPGVGVSTEEEEDLKDALSPIYDQLKLKRWWWILEVAPLRLRYQRGNNEWVTFWGVNNGQGRFIPKQHKNGFKVHRTVRTRMEASHPEGKKEKYVPAAHFAIEPTWMD